MQLQEAHDKIRQLKIENETLKAASPSSSNSGSRRVGDSTNWLKSPLLFPFKQEIIAFAKKVAVLEELWSNENAFLQPCPAVAPSLMERYSKTEAYNCYVTNMLYTYLPSKLHPSLENLVAFKDAVSFEFLMFYNLKISHTVGYVSTN
jgi:hypothetical protein